MMKRRFLSVIFLLRLLTLCACTLESQSESYTKPVDQPTVGGALKEAFLFHIPSIEVEHGEDYTINWVDPGMEAYMRFLLEKPEGDILHSDVWDIQVLVIRNRSISETAAAKTMKWDSTKLDASGLLAFEY